jgi:hypothetical protein
MDYSNLNQNIKLSNVFDKHYNRISHIFILIFYVFYLKFYELDKSPNAIAFKI